MFHRDRCLRRPDMQPSGLCRRLVVVWRSGWTGLQTLCGSTTVVSSPSLSCHRPPTTFSSCGRGSQPASTGGLHYSGPSTTIERQTWNRQHRHDNRTVSSSASSRVGAAATSDKLSCRVHAGYKCYWRRLPRQLQRRRRHSTLKLRMDFNPYMGQSVRINNRLSAHHFCEPFKN